MRRPGRSNNLTQWRASRAAIAALAADCVVFQRRRRPCHMLAFGDGDENAQLFQRHGLRS